MGRDMAAKWRVTTLTQDGTTVEIEHVSQWQLVQGWIEFTLEDNSFIVIPGSLGWQFSLVYTTDKDK